MFGSRLINFLYLKIVLPYEVIELFLLVPVLFLRIFLNLLKKLLDIDEKMMIVENKLNLFDIAKLLEVSLQII